MRAPFHSSLKRKVRTMAGTHEGRVLVFPQLTEALTPFDDKPQARKIVDADGGNLTLMELAIPLTLRPELSACPYATRTPRMSVP